MKPNIILTFDYEIFFGEQSGTFENSIYKPVEKLRRIMNEERIKGVFFIDILYYVKMQEYPELQNISLLMKRQIQALLKDGHDVELHLHPHWLNAEYREGKWKFKYDKYRFEQLDLTERDEVFEKGIKNLLEICREVEKTYEIKGYRAGGWCIQPFDIFYPYFKKYQIKYDSSIVEIGKRESIGHKFDFTKCLNKEIYRFNRKIEEEEENGKFIEYKISTFKYNIFEKIFNKIRNYKKKHKVFGDGIGIKLELPSNGIFEKLKNKKVIYSLEFPYLSTINKKLKREKNKNIIFLSHPKGMTIEGIQYLKLLKRKNYRFIKYGEIIKI